MLVCLPEPATARFKRALIGYREAIKLQVEDGDEVGGATTVHIIQVGQQLMTDKPVSKDFYAALGIWALRWALEVPPIGGLYATSPPRPRTNFALASA